MAAVYTPRMSMLDATRAAVAALARREGVDYCDARYQADEVEQLYLRDDEVDRLARTRRAGFGVRVLYQGAWGFAAEPGAADDLAAATRAAEAALATARAAATVNTVRVRLAEEPPQEGCFTTPIARDPFTVPLAEKLADLRAVIAALRSGADPRVKSATARAEFRRIDKAFASSEGSAVEQHLWHGAAGMQVTVAEGDVLERRSDPMDHGGRVAARGYELVGSLDLAGRAAALREEALALLAAPPCPAGKTTVILVPSQLALQIHESCGHPTESDRAMGEEISLAGGSFLTPDRQGRFRYGSAHVNLVADALTPGAPATHGWDDEGVPARRTPLVSRGQFVGYLSSRETAARLGLGRSAGCLRAENYARPPIIRMINVSMEPDPRGPTLAELIADTDDGILMGSNKSWSIDDLRLNFQFGCEVAWEIKRGKRTRLLRRPIYTGITPRFWGGCDAVGSGADFEMHGFLTCGKGDPMQTMWVGHGCPPARFRGVEVGSGA